jgi:hypothetical protein
VLYQRDYLHLLVKYGLEPPSQLGDQPMPAEVRPLRFDVGDDSDAPPARADDHRTGDHRADNGRADNRRAESA